MSAIGNLWIKFIHAGTQPTDSEDQKLRKSSLTVMAAPFALAGLLWGVMYFAQGLYLPGWIPFSYGVLSILSIAYFIKTKRFTFFRNSQLFLILMLPFLLQLSLGGFIPSSGVVLWAIISPMAALVFFDTKSALRWFLAFVFLVVLAYLINDRVSEFFSWNLSETFINLVFMMNILAVCSLVFMIQHYFVGRRTKLKDAIEVQNVQLQEQSELLKELDETKSRFFANISHEFRTPLTLILGLLEKQIVQSNTDEDVNTMKRNADRLLQLINQLLDLSKLESGKLELRTTTADIVEFTRLTAMLFGSAAETRGIAFRINGATLPQSAVAPAIATSFDQEQMQKVLTNLISNAIKFTPENGEIDINLEPRQEVIYISVTNTGESIPDEKLPHVFDRFYQVDETSTREYEGTGIGLALVKELVELHDGRVKAESAKGRTTFIISLPIVQGELPLSDLINQGPTPEVETQTNSETLPTDDPIDSALEVLIVEDYPDLRKFISQSLDGDYRVIEAVDGEDGWSKAESTIPDLIISDVMMPKMDGYQLCEKIKTNPKTNHIPIIMLTAKASRENKLQGLETGADDYLIKPFDAEELNARIKNLVKNRRRLQEKYEQEVWLKPREVKVSSVHQKFIKNLKEIIEKHLDDNSFSVDVMGHEIGMSRSQVHRKLKALTNQSSTTFIRNYRLHRAADLLEQQAGNVTEIAYQVGFSSQTYFTQCFTGLFGMAPSEYVPGQRVE